MAPSPAAVSAALLAATSRPVVWPPRVRADWQPQWQWGPVLAGWQAAAAHTAGNWLAQHSRRCQAPNARPLRPWCRSGLSSMPTLGSNPSGPGRPPRPRPTATAGERRTGWTRAATGVALGKRCPVWLSCATACPTTRCPGPGKLQPGPWRKTGAAFRQRRSSTAIRHRCDTARSRGWP